MRILIIEDDKELAMTLKDGLTQYGLICDISNYGKDGEEKALVNEYDAILLDLNLPDKDGIDILKYLRNMQIPVPIVIVTARDDIAQRAKGLDLGADDYITKPFDFLELRARIQAVIRRSYGRTKNEIMVGQLKIDPKIRTAKYQDQFLNLSAKEFDILEYISSRHPEVVSSEDICEHIYDEYFDPFSSVIRVHISNLRKKLKLLAKKDVLITFKGKGYKLCED